MERLERRADGERVKQLLDSAPRADGVPTSGAKACALLGLSAKEKGLIEDLDQPYYFKS